MKTKKTIDAYGRLTVSKNGESVTLAFVDRDVQFSAKWALRRLGFTIDDDFFGFGIQQDVESAVHLAEVLCRDRGAA
jgi:hypothetical protein